VTEAWYGQITLELGALNRQAEARFRAGEIDDAGTLVTKGQAMAARLLSVPRPTLAAMEAASDLDDLYGRILLVNHNVGWGRLVFQKNLVRWKNWRPETADTIRRRKQAEAEIRECDRLLSQ